MLYKALPSLECTKKKKKANFRLGATFPLILRLLVFQWVDAIRIRNVHSAPAVFVQARNELALEQIKGQQRAAFG